MIGHRLSVAALVSFLFVLVPDGLLIEDHSAAHTEALRSTLYGLDLATVTLYVVADPKYDERLRSRILSRLTGKKLSINSTRPFKQGEPLLQVTLNWEPIDELGPNKGLYYRKIDLSESVVTERMPRVRAWASTASYGIPEPIISDRPTIEKLERDLDWLLDAFIKDYSDANGTH